MSIITCGLAGEGIYASVIPFATTPYLTLFSEDIVEEEFDYVTKEVGFTTDIRVVEFEIGIIKIEECSWPVA